MADIFISYASQDREKARGLAGVLKAQGWSVWWDRTILPGKSFVRVIEEELGGAKCVLVLWSEAATTSEWVQNEATEGMRRGILVPAMLQDINVPLPFRHLQTADLSDWSGEQSHSELAKLLKSIQGGVGEAGQPGTAFRSPSSSGTVAAATATKVVAPEPDKVAAPKLPWFRLFLETPWLKVALSCGVVMVVVGGYLTIGPGLKMGIDPVEGPGSGALNPGPDPVEVPHAGSVKLSPGTDQRPTSRFRANRDTVTDTRSGLIWMRRDIGREINWYQAEQYCKESRLGGHSDWRLPTLQELRGLYLASSKSRYKISGVFRLTGCCPWSSTKRDAKSAWAFAFTYGGQTGYPLDADVLGALCVRAAGD